MVAPLVQTGKRDQVDVIVRVHGGGITGQADVCRFGIARAQSCSLPSGKGLTTAIC